MNLLKDIFKRLYLFEKLTLFYIPICYLLFWVFKFKPNYMGLYPVYEFFAALCIGYIMLFIYLLFKTAKNLILDKRHNLPLKDRARISAFNTVEFAKRQYINPLFFTDVIRITLTMIILLLFFTNLKQIIPLINPKLFDAPMWRLDKIFHFGLSPTLFALRRLKGNLFLHFIDRLYITFFLKNIIIPWIFLLQNKSKSLRNAFFSTICLCWIIGGFSYFLFPAMGPCYYKHGLFNSLDIPIARGLQELLLREYIIFRNNPLTYQAKNFYGIAAMPSLHIAIITVFVLYAKRLNPLLFLLLSAYLILMFVGSVVLGWHYAIDGYAGIILAIFCYWVIKKVDLRLFKQ